MEGRTLACAWQRMALALLIGLVPMAAQVRALPVDPPAGTRVTGVAVRDRGGDATVVIVTFDGPIAGHLRFHMDGGSPRALLRIAGIVEAYRPYEVPVDDGRVVRVRIGHHPELDPPEEHLVFDLVDAGVAITRVVEDGEGLTVVLERVASPGPSRPAVPATPTPTVVRPTAAAPAPTLSPTPTRTVTPTATSPSPPPATPTPPLPTPTSSPPVASPPATPTPPAPRRPPREASPPPATPTTGVPAGPRATAPLPRPTGFSGPLITELVIAHRDDGSALVRVSADGSLERTDVRYFGVRATPPRNVLTIDGGGLPGEDAVLRVRDGLLCEIQVVFNGDAQPPRIEMTFFLASSAVTAERAAVKGNHAVIHLVPPDDPDAPLDCEVEARSGTRGWRFTAGGPPTAFP